MSAETAFQWHSSLAGTSKPEEDTTQAESEPDVKPEALMQTHLTVTWRATRRTTVPLATSRQRGCGGEDGAEDGGPWDPTPTYILPKAPEVWFFPPEHPKNRPPEAVPFSSSCASSSSSLGGSHLVGVGVRVHDFETRSLWGEGDSELSCCHGQAVRGWIFPSWGL